MCMCVFLAIKQRLEDKVEKIDKTHTEWSGWQGKIATEVGGFTGSPG